MASELKVKYQEEVVSVLMKRFGYKNAHQVPHLVKVVINIGVSAVSQNPNVLEGAANELAVIAGQRPIITKAKGSISAFKVRQGMPIGCKVTLRGDRMYDFLYKLFSIALPRIRDFGGISPDSFDGRGNYTLGVKEHTIFPEVNYDEIEQVRGMNITIVTSAKTDEESRVFLELLGMPFKAQPG